MSELTIRIVVPGWTPTLDLSPNRPTHWRTKQRHKDAARHLVMREIRAWRNNHGLFGDDVLIAGPATIRVSVLWEPMRKTWDADNLMAALKSVVDAFEQTGVIANDKYLVWAPIQQGRDPERRGSVTLTVEPIEEERR